jgi:hypothetical protein
VEGGVKYTSPLTPLPGERGIELRFEEVLIKITGHYLFSINSMNLFNNHKNSTMQSKSII